MPSYKHKLMSTCSWTVLGLMFEQRVARSRFIASKFKQYAYNRKHKKQ